MNEEEGRTNMVQVSHARQGRVFYPARLALVLTVAMTLFLANQFVHAPPAYAYACGNGCRGAVAWLGGPVNGASSSFTVVPLTGSVGNYLEVAQNFACSPSACLVSVGYTTYSSSSGTTVNYFWLDIRHFWWGNSYYEHPLSQVPSADFGQFAFFAIDRVSGSAFQVNINSPNFSYTGFSTDNSMVPGAIAVEQGFDGSSGASAPGTDFTRNQWIDTNNVSHFQTADGFLSSDNPPYAWYVQYPHASSTGGDIHMQCC
jgi:hypothetical protein